MTAPLLAVEGLVKRFPTGRGVVHAVSDVSFEIGRGEALGLVGESGSGKTTVGRCVLRLIQPDAGTIRFKGEDVTRLPPPAFRRLRAGIQLVFQDPQDALNPRMRLGDAIAEPARLTQGLSGGERARRVDELLDLVGLDRRVARLYPHQISGGEQQRIGIARAISTDADLVVLDEPTSALDVSIQVQIIQLLKGLQERRGLTFMFISHDLRVVRAIAHEVVVMKDGRIVEAGPTEQVMTRPAEPYTQALLRAAVDLEPID